MSCATMSVPTSQPLASPMSCGSHLLTARLPEGAGGHALRNLRPASPTLSPRTLVQQRVNFCAAAAEAQDTSERGSCTEVECGSDAGRGCHHSANPLYKTELCRSFEETAHCKYGGKCQFAHGAAELRPVARHVKYKTTLCRTFATTGACPYGTRCRFIHGQVDAGPPTPLSSPRRPSAASLSEVAAAPRPPKRGRSALAAGRPPRLRKLRFGRRRVAAPPASVPQAHNGR